MGVSTQSTWEINHDLNNINTIKYFADHLAKMNKTLVFILLGLVTMVLSANEEEDQTKEQKEAVEGNSLEVERVQRAAEPGKKKKGGKVKGKGDRKGKNVKGKGARKGQ